MVDDKGNFTKICEALMQVFVSHKPTRKDALRALVSVSAANLWFLACDEEDIEEFIKGVRDIHSGFADMVTMVNKEGVTH